MVAADKCQLGPGVFSTPAQTFTVTLGRGIEPSVWGGEGPGESSLLWLLE